MRDAVESLAQQIAVSDMRGLSDLFRNRHSPVPAVTWSPDSELDGYVLERTFASICRTVAREDGRIWSADINLDDFGALVDWLSVLKTGVDGMLRYAYIGKANFGTQPVDLVGKRPESLPGAIGLYLAATCLASNLRGLPLLTVHRPSGQRFPSTWRRTIMPLAGENGNSGCLVLNCGSNDLRAGLEVVPAAVLIVDADMMVCHANKAARVMFDQGTLSTVPQGLFEFSGLDLSIDISPEDILRHGVHRRVTARHVGLQRLGSYRVLFSAALHYGTAYYVLLIQHPEDMDN